MRKRVSRAFYGVVSSSPLYGTRSLIGGVVDLVMCVPTTYYASDGTPADSTHYYSVLLVPKSLEHDSMSVMQLFESEGAYSARWLTFCWEVTQDG